MKKLVALLLTGVLSLSMVACSSKTEEANVFPTKPIEIVVAYKAGGGTDVGARILTSEAEKLIGQPLVILNLPGADGELGFTELANATPDGYKIGFINLPTFVSIPLQRTTQYDKDDVVPIINHVYDPGVLVVLGTSEIKTLEDFVAYAKANPEDLTVANNGTGASNHIGAAHFALEAGIELTHVPFGGSADMLAALRGDHVDAAVAKISEVAQLANSGELRILATYTKDRLTNFSEVPTMTEKGYEILFGSARALVAPKGTPDDVIAFLHDKFKAAMETEGHIQAAKNAELPIMYMSGEELAEYIKNEENYLKEIVPQLGF